MSTGLCPRAKEVLQLVVAEGRITRSAINRTLPDFIASAYARDLVDAGILVCNDASDPAFSLASAEYADVAAAHRRIREYRAEKAARRLGPILTTAPMLDAIVTSLSSMGANQNEIYLY